jgi:hypothetical protein
MILNLVGFADNRGLVRRVMISEGRCEKLCHNTDIYIAVNGQTHPPVPALDAKFDRLTGPCTPAIDPCSKRPHRVRRLEQRDHCCSIHTDCHNRVEDNTAKDGQGLCQALPRQFRYCIFRDRGNHSGLIMPVLHETHCLSWL